MMVKLETRIVSRHWPRVARLGDHTHVGEVLESPVDRGAGDSVEAGLDRVENLIGRRVIIQVEHGFEDHPALYCAALAALTAEPPEILEARLFGGLLHVLDPRTTQPLIELIDDNMLQKTKNVN